MQRIFRTRSLKATKGLNKAYKIVSSLNGVSSINGIETYRNFGGNIRNLKTEVELANDFHFFKVWKHRYYVVSVYVYEKEKA